jgi:hypothetical protein
MLLPLPQLIVFQTVTTLPILPLPRSNKHHSNRLDFLFPTVRLTPSHCHSNGHSHTTDSQCHSHRHFFFHFFPPFLKTVTTRPILPLPHPNRYHSNRPDLTNRMVPLPPRHCHSTIRASRRQPTESQHCHFFSLFPPLFSSGHNSANTATTKSQPPPFEPP